MRRAPYDADPHTPLEVGRGNLTPPPTRCKARSGAVRTAKVLSVKVRGVCGVRAQGRCVNNRVNLVCAHGGRASWCQAMRSARCGWAGKGRRACSVPRVGVPARRGGADARSARGSGFPEQGEGLRASVRPCPGRLCPPRSVGGPGCLLTRGSVEGTLVGLPVLSLLPRRPPAVGSHRRPAARCYATPAV